MVTIDDNRQHECVDKDPVDKRVEREGVTYGDRM